MQPSAERRSRPQRKLRVCPAQRSGCHQERVPSGLFPSYRSVLELPSDRESALLSRYLLLSEALGGEFAYSTRQPSTYVVDNADKQKRC